MKKIIGAIILVGVVLLGVVFFKNRIGSMFLMNRAGGDLVIVNDCSDTVSSEYRQDGKVVAQVVKPGEQISNGKGLIRVFTSKKSGVYEIQYPYPRPAGKPATVALTSVMNVVKNETTGDVLYTKKGMIDDVVVSYEELND